MFHSYSLIDSMSYTHEHVPVVPAKQGYNRLSKHYASYHKQLTAWDKAACEKCLPRSLCWVQVLDLWWGDGRRAKLLLRKEIARRVIVDQAEDLLVQAPWRTEKILADLEQPLPISEDGVFDLILCNFVLLHLQGTTLFAEARRLVAPTWRMLLFHHQERRPYLHDVQNESFKIETFYRRDEEILQCLEEECWTVDVFTVDESTTLYCCFPR